MDKVSDEPLLYRLRHRDEVAFLTTLRECNGRKARAPAASVRALLTGLKSVSVRSSEAIPVRPAGEVSLVRASGVLDLSPIDLVAFSRRFERAGETCLSDLVVWRRAQGEGDSAGMFSDDFISAITELAIAALEPGEAA